MPSMLESAEPDGSLASAYRLSMRLIVPLLRNPFPGRWKVFGALINNPLAARMWQPAGLRWVRSKTNGFIIPCDLSVFSGRIAWFFRRWYEIDTESVLQTCLPAEGTFVDIGANVGMASLSARRAIGVNGRIVAFEPQPAIAEIFREAIRRNKVENIEIVEAAISSEPGTAAFFSPDENHGEAHFDEQVDRRPGQRLTVQVVDGTRLEKLNRLDAIKIDVEGHELAVLEGIEKTIRKFRPLVICELIAQHLLRERTSPQQIVNFFARCDYSAFSIQIEDANLLLQRARIAPMSSAGDDISCNALFVPKERVPSVIEATFVPLPK